MKKCASELELEAFIREDAAAAVVPGASAGVFSAGGDLPGFCFGESNDPQVWWPASIRIPHPAASATIESPAASISASPRATTSANHAPESDSDSDSESLLELGGSPCQRGTRRVETKRIRRMVSNRESARRSRRRKQAQLADIELQVEKLKSENASLFKHLTVTNQKFTTAVTDNRILKSDVETLRVKVKMAEDMVARTAMSCGLGHLGLAPFLNSRKVCQALDMLTVAGLDLPGDGTSFKGLTPSRQVQISPVQSTASLDSLDHRISSEVASCAVDIWP